MAKQTETKAFLDRIIQGIQDLSTLEVKTIVGGFSEDDTTKKLKGKEGSQMIWSKINLIDGDITTALSEKFLKEPYNKMVEYHMNREIQAHDIIQKNIAAVKELITLLSDAQKEKNKAPETTP